MSNRYAFKTADGRTCCEGNDLETLCPDCRTAALAAIPPSPTDDPLYAYRPALARLSPHWAGSRPTARQASAEDQDGFLHPPDGYQIALTRRQEGRS